jgi:hypothetical protein
LNHLEEIIDLGTDDVNCQSLVLGGNFQAKQAQQKQEVAHFPNDYPHDRVNWSWRRDVGQVETAWNSGSVDEMLMQVRENANWKAKCGRIYCPLAFFLHLDWRKLGWIARLLGDSRGYRVDKHRTPGSKRAATSYQVSQVKGSESLSATANRKWLGLEAFAT